MNPFQFWSEAITFFSFWVFFQEHSQITGQQRKREVIPLTPFWRPLYQFYSLHSIYCIELASAHTLWLNSNWKPYVSERKSLTIKLRRKLTEGLILSMAINKLVRELIQINTNWRINTFIWKSFECHSMIVSVSPVGILRVFEYS